MFNHKHCLILLLFVCTAFASTENYTNASEIQAEMNGSFCGSSNFTGTISIALIVMTAFFVAVTELIVFLGTKWWLSGYNKKNPDAKLRMRDFMKFPWTAKLLLIVFGILPLLTMLLMILFVVLWSSLFSMLASIVCRFGMPFASR
ncbi:hypothetical protein H0N98_04460 [Candidatus Micrarchaeota archaeon]|nr:hypothetical protein [Candidatus Micrarchaeota archaeon]